jgi:hypothetical protein
LSDRSLRMQRLLQRTRYRPAHDDDLRRSVRRSRPVRERTVAEAEEPSVAVAMMGDGRGAVLA